MYRRNGSTSTSTMATLLQPNSNCIKSLATASNLATAGDNSNGSNSGAGADTTGAAAAGTATSAATAASAADQAAPGGGAKMSGAAGGGGGSAVQPAVNGNAGTNHLGSNHSLGAGIGGHGAAGLMGGLSGGVAPRPLLPHEMGGQQSMLLPHQQPNHHFQFGSNSFGSFSFSNHHNSHSLHGHHTTNTGTGTTTTILSNHHQQHHHHNHNLLPHQQHHHHQQQHHLPHLQQQHSLPHLQQRNQNHHHNYLPHQLSAVTATASQSNTALANGGLNGSSGSAATSHHLHHHHPLSPGQQHAQNSNSSSSSAAGQSQSPEAAAEAGGSSTTGGEVADGAAGGEPEPEPEIDIVINNVVCSFSVRCHLNLREIALNGVNVEFRRENGMVTMKLRRPYTTASIWSSGRITCTGATSEEQARVAARRYARCLQRLGFNVRFRHFRVVNVLGTCSMPWAIKIVNFSEKYKRDASYEPELHPGVTYKLKWPKATLKIFSTGSITVTANSVENVQKAIEHIFPLVYEFRKQRAPDDPKLLKQQAAAAAAAAEKAAIAEASASTADSATTAAAGSAASPGASDTDPSNSTTAAALKTTATTGGALGGKAAKAALALAARRAKLKRKNPFGLASNDPADDIMFVSDVEDDDDEDDDMMDDMLDEDDLIEEDYGEDDDDDDVDGVGLSGRGQPSTTSSSSLKAATH